MHRVRRLMTAFFSRVMRTRLAHRLILPVFPPLHLRLYRLTRGRVNISSLLVPTLILHTTGAKTGYERETPLMTVPEPGGSYLVSGSNWGLPQHPAWTANLIAHPHAVIEVGRRRQDVVAELLSDAARAEAWPLLEAHFPGYRSYETAAHRQMRIFRLTPLP